MRRGDQKVASAVMWGFELRGIRQEETLINRGVDGWGCRPIRHLIDKKKIDLFLQIIPILLHTATDC